MFDTEFQGFRHLVVVAQELNLRRAAERLGIPQPTLSRQISSLEAVLGLDLFVRERGRITHLTAAGVRYLSDVQQLLRMSDHAIQSARDIAEGRAGRLRLGVCDDATTDNLARILASFRSELPSVDFDILELPSPDQATALRRNDIDLAIISPPIDERDLIIEPLWREDWYVAFSSDHELRHFERISCHDLTRTALILAHPELAPGGHDHIRDAFLAAGITLDVAVHALRRSTMIMLAASGGGVTFVPGAVASMALPGLSFRPFLSDPLTIAAAFRAYEPPGLAMRFLRTARQLLDK